MKARSGTAEDVRHVPGEVGVWVFILGEMVVFGVLFGTYLFYRGQEPKTFDDAQRALAPGFGVGMTLLLLTASLLVVIGVRSVREGKPSIAPRAFLAAAACGVAFGALKVVDYHDMVVHHETPSTNPFFLHYFVLTGIHLFHLMAGLVILGFLSTLSRKRHLSGNQFAFVEAGACYWHMVDLLWIVLFPLLYFVR
jgi:nitric oxide reductase NorE protein